MIHWSFFSSLGWAARTTGLNQLEATQEALRTNFVGKWINEFDFVTA